MAEVIINGTDGKIEGKYHQNKDPKSPSVLILHPHPLYGGTMHNKVVYNLSKIFIKNNFSVLRINFRGVGKSQGKFDEGKGEVKDVISALSWLHDKNMEASRFWISGFSFGAWVGLQAVMRRPDISNYILVSPPVNKKYDYNFIVPCPASGLIVQGKEDEIAPKEGTKILVEKLSDANNQIYYELIEGADHFFTGYKEIFYNVVEKYIKKRVEANFLEIDNIRRDRRRRRKKSSLSTNIKQNVPLVQPLFEEN